ncbi:MAG TPA: hypothetical protein VHL59_13640, partial [Thermoanaerobaculia bacterium]|nr:hypothetical protein [Thermoanaerobaculia bacterium]
MRFFRTVRHLSLRQIATRAARVVERAWWRVAKPKAPTATAPPPVPLGPSPAPPRGEGAGEGLAQDIA